MSGYIKYFDDGGKNMLFVTGDKEVYEKYNEIWEVVRKHLKLTMQKVSKYFWLFAICNNMPLQNYKTTKLLHNITNINI